MKSSSVRAGRSPLQCPHPVLFGFFSGSPDPNFDWPNQTFRHSGTHVRKIMCSVFSFAIFFSGLLTNEAAATQISFDPPSPLSRLPLSQHDRNFPERSSQDLSHVCACHDGSGLFPRYCTSLSSFLAFRLQRASPSQVLPRTTPCLAGSSGRTSPDDSGRLACWASRFLPPRWVPPFRRGSVVRGPWPANRPPGSQSGRFVASLH